MSHFNLLLISAWIQFWFVAIISKYFDFIKFKKKKRVSLCLLLDQPTGASWNMVYAAPVISLTEIFILSAVFSQALLT